MQAEVCRLPFPTGRFDHVVCANSFHYFREPLQALREVRRVMRPAGGFTLVDWCDDYLACKVCSVWLRLTDPAFHRTYSLKACRSLLGRAGFDVVEARRFRANWPWGLMRLTCRRGP
jgi:ubiquinone/menaquinone biosynthesis C-methylase UbiE